MIRPQTRLFLRHVTLKMSCAIVPTCTYDAHFLLNGDTLLSLSLSLFLSFSLLLSLSLSLSLSMMFNVGHRFAMPATLSYCRSGCLVKRTKTDVSIPKVYHSTQCELDTQANTICAGDNCAMLADSTATLT